MYCCEQCLENIWNCRFIDGYIRAECALCGFEIELEIKEDRKCPVFYIDGGCYGNGRKDIKKRKMISVVSDSGGEILIEEPNLGGSNNIAEFIALERVMEYAIANNLDKIKVITDSKNNLAWFYGKKIGKNINDGEGTLKIKQNIERMKQKVRANLKWEGRESNLAGHYIENTYNL